MTTIIHPVNYNDIKNGGKLSNDELDRYNLDNKNVYVDDIELTQKIKSLLPCVSPKLS